MKFLVIFKKFQVIVIRINNRFSKSYYYCIYDLKKLFIMIQQKIIIIYLEIFDINIAVKVFNLIIKNKNLLY